MFKIGTVSWTDKGDGFREGFLLWKPVLVMKLLRTPTHARDRSGRRWLSSKKQ